MPTLTLTMTLTLAATSPSSSSPTQNLIRNAPGCRHRHFSMQASCSALASMNPRGMAQSANSKDIGPPSPAWQEWSVRASTRLAPCVILASRSSSRAASCAGVPEPGGVHSRADGRDHRGGPAAAGLPVPGLHTSPGAAAAAAAARHCGPAVQLPPAPDRGGRQVRISCACTLRAEHGFRSRRVCGLSSLHAAAVTLPPIMTSLHDEVAFLRLLPI